MQVCKGIHAFAAKDKMYASAHSAYRRISAALSRLSRRQRSSRPGAASRYDPEPLNPNPIELPPAFRVYGLAAPQDVGGGEQAVQAAAQPGAASRYDPGL